MRRVTSFSVFPQTSDKSSYSPATPYRAQIATLIRMLQQLGLYESEFEVPYVLITQRFYKDESNAFVSSRWCISFYHVLDLDNR